MSTALPICNVTIPSTPLVEAALAYTRQHTSPSTVNHCLRSTAFALLLARKLPPFANVDAETVALSTIMHDMGWAVGASKALLSTDKRFEVDGANLARDFIASQANSWDAHRLQLVWDGIALHTTPSIALHKQPEVAITAMGILGDFLGPHHPTGAISVPEFQEVVAAFPRLQFREELPSTLCGLCVDKPEATYDSFVADFGARFLEGQQRETYLAGREKASSTNMLLGGLEACMQYE
jgi:hypothetical protein